jgi:hypothetical protein
MKIRITQPGFETFSGQLGDIQFDNGVSTQEVSQQQAEFMSTFFLWVQEVEGDGYADEEVAV